MTAEQFHREKMYQATICIMKSLRDRGLMTEADYTVASALMLEKYNPLLSRLMVQEC